MRKAASCLLYIQQQLLLTMHRRQRGVGGGGGDAGDVDAVVQNSSWTSKSTRRFVLLHRLRLKIVWWLPFLLLLLQQLLQIPGARLHLSPGDC